MLEGDRLAGELVPRRAGEDDLVSEERLEHDTAVPTTRTDHAELELTIGHLVDDRLGVRDGEAHADLGVALVKLAEKQGDDGSPGACRGADLERSRDLAAVAGRKLLEEALLECEQPLCGRVELESRLGGLDTAP